MGAFSIFPSLLAGAVVGMHDSSGLLSHEQSTAIMLGVNCYRVSSPLLSRKVSTAKVIGCLYFQFNPCLYQQSRQQHDDQREEQ